MGAGDAELATVPTLWASEGIQHNYTSGALHMLGQGTKLPKSPRAEIPAGPQGEPHGIISIMCFQHAGAW